MSDPLHQQMVSDFILETKENLDTAARIARAFPILQRKLVQTTLDDLEKLMRAKLGKEWEIWNNRDEVLLKRYSGFYIRRKSWGEIYILLEFQKQEENTVVGVWRDRTKSKAARFDSEITNAFAKANLSGSAGRWWAWYQSLPSERGNFNAATALAEMQFRRNEIANYWARQLLLVHEIAAPVIDAAISK